MAVPASHPSPRDSVARTLRELGERTSVAALAREQSLPLLPSLAELLGETGLQRGSTVLLEGSPFPGTTSLALALLAQASAEGMWCALFGLPELGFVAAAELGVCLDRLVLVRRLPGREAMFLSTLLEGCDVVCAALSQPLPRLEARRLVARVRERRGVLVLCPLPHLGTSSARRLWPEVADLTLTVRGGHFLGLEEGVGRIRARSVEVALSRRRGAPGEQQGRLWLPDSTGGVTAASAEELPGLLQAIAGSR